jgi:hypothetical protein
MYNVIEILVIEMHISCMEKEHGISYILSIIFNARTTDT